MVRYSLLTMSLVILLAAVVPVQLRAQLPLWEMQQERDRPSVFVDYARFRSDLPGKLRLEIYYQVFHTGLRFEQSGNTWTAKYEVEAVVKDDDDREVTSFSRVQDVTVQEESRADSKFDFRTSQINFDLPPGDYKVEFTLRDKNSRKVLTREIDVDLKKFESSAPLMSDVKFTQAVGKLEDTNNVFRAGNLQIVPSVSKAFGGSEDSRLLYYFEIYPGSDSDETVIVETRLRHRQKGMVYRDTLHTHLQGPVERQLREISLAEFPPGEYEMELYLRGRRFKKLEKRTYDFEVLWSRDALVRFDWEKAIRQLSYISEPGELDGMEDISSVEERKRAFGEFWQRRDPTAGTVENEALSEFYHRVEIANRRFSIMRREGWQTDRGRIFIQFGEPDEIDDHPYSPSEHPYQIWHYYMSGPYRRFTFVDEKEDGDYRLIFPYDGLYQTPDF
jgi:GWxTD domain-containing protein